MPASSRRPNSDAAPMFKIGPMRHKQTANRLPGFAFPMSFPVRRLTLALVAGSALGGLPAAAAQLYGTEVVQQATIRFYDLNGSDLSGWQMVTPLTWVGTYAIAPGWDADVSLKTAWIFAEADYFGTDADYSGLSDSIAGVTLSYSGAKSWQPFFTLDFNLPTGKSAIDYRETLTLADPDLVDLARYGEGFNTNASAGASFFLSPEWTLTTALGFNVRGQYKPFAGSGDMLEPGDQLTALVRAQYLTERYFVSLQLRYRHETVTQLRDEAYVKPGDRLELKGEAAYQLDAASTISLLASWSWWEKNAYYDFFADAAVKEATNSNGDVYYGELKYQRDLGAVDLRAFASVKRRTTNDYDTIDFRFRPERTVWRIGASIDWALSDATALTFGASGGQVIDDPSLFSGEVVWANWSLTAGASFSF